MNPLADLRAARQLWRLLRRHRVDVLHTHNPKPGIYGRIVGRLAGVPIVVNTIHGLYATDDDPAAKRQHADRLEQCSPELRERVVHLRRVGRMHGALHEAIALEVDEMLTRRHRCDRQSPGRLFDGHASGALQQNEQLLLGGLHKPGGQPRLFQYRPDGRKTRPDLAPSPILET